MLGILCKANSRWFVPSKWRMCGHCNTLSHLCLRKSTKAGISSMVELPFFCRTGMRPYEAGGSIMRRSFVRASVFALFITQSQAATLEIQGSALVDKGAGFMPASNNALLDGGDRVRATKGCYKIIYENGYRTKVCNGQLAVVFST